MISMETTGDCTIFRVTGEVTANEILRQASRYMAGEQTETSMWDFTGATRVKISTLEMKRLADSLRTATRDRTVRRVALVGSANINIGLGKLFTAFAQMAGLPFRYKVFRDLPHATAWLDAP